MRLNRGIRIYRQWKEKLTGARSHDLLVFLFFLAVSFTFWMLQALNENLEREVIVTLRLTNVPEDVVIIDSLPSQVSVTLRDKGLALARHSIYSVFHPNTIDIDFGKHSSESDDASVTIAHEEMYEMLKGQFAATTRLQEFRPDTIGYGYNHGRSRILPIRLNANLKAAAQNYIQSVTLTPDSIRVFAPASMLDTMRAVYTDPITLHEIKEPLNFQIPLQSRMHLKYTQQQVNVKVGIGYYTEKTLSIPIIGLNFPANKKLRTFPAKATITCRVESGSYHRISPEDFVLATTYEELMQNAADSKLMLHLKSLPSGVSDVRISPLEVDYLIEENIVEEGAR